MFFFSKDPAQSSASGNPIDSFHPLGVVFKNRSKAKKWSEGIKNDTKAGKTQVWTKLRQIVPQRPSP